MISRIPAVADRTAPVPGPFWQVGPIHADVNLTNGCDLGCWHCHASSGARMAGELSLEEVRRVINQLHSMGVLSVAFAGGEPFLRRDIVEILAEATAKPGWNVSVITNGTSLANGGIAAELARQCPDLGVNVSLDGSSALGFGILRRQRGATGQTDTGLFDRVTRGIRAAVDAGLAVSVNFTMTAATIADAERTYRLVVDGLGVEGMVAIKFFPAGFGRDHLQMLELPYPRWRDEFVRLTQHRLAGHLDRMQMSVPAAWEFYLPLIESGIDVVAAEDA